MPQIVPRLSSQKYRQLNDIRFAMVEPNVRCRFCGRSALMPPVSMDAVAARLVGSLNVRIEMWFSGGDRCIEYRTKPQRLVLHDIGAGSNSSQWQSSGNILAVLDLRGAQMVVNFHPRRTDQVTRPASARRFRAFIDSLQALWLPKTRFVARQLPNGDVAYEFAFPRTLEEILSLQPRHGR